MIIKTYKTSEFLNLANKTARDRRISTDASGFLVHCLSYSDEMEFDVRGLQEIFGFGRDKLLRITNELKQFGYLAITRNRTQSGYLDNYDWHFFDISQPCDFRDRAATDLFFSNFHLEPGYPDSGSSRVRFNLSQDNPHLFKKKNGLKGKKNEKGKKRKTDGREDADNTPAQKKIKTAPSAVSKEFLIFAKLCFGFPPDKIEFLSETQKCKIETELQRFAAAGIDLKDLIFFSDFWRDSWRSIDRKYKTFQRPRPEQIFELYFEFLESARLTEIRLDFEKNYEQIKLEKQKNGNGNGNGNKFDAISEYDYTEFAFITFDGKSE